MKIYLLLLLTFLGPPPFANAQENADIAVEQARQKAYSKDFDGADDILTSFTADNNDINALRLHAQVLYWKQDFKRSREIHQKLQGLYPDNADVKLDYGRFLYETGKIGAAEKILKQFLIQDPDHAEANIMLSYIEIWNGRMASAIQRALKLHNLYPDNQDFIAVLDKIKKDTAPSLELGVGSQSDDQPLSFNVCGLSGKWYKSWLFSPSVSFRKRNFTSFEHDYSTSFFEASNQIYLKSKTTMNFKGGIFYSNAIGNSIYTKGFGIKQQLLRGLTLNFTAEELPYQYTVSSIAAPFIEDRYHVYLKLEKPNGLLGEVGLQKQLFPDNNTITASYLWILLPFINEKGFRFSGGYSYNFSTSEKSTFVVTESTSGGGGPGFPPAFSRPVSSAEGYYDLYFTPQNQQVNSLLASMRIGSDKTNLNTSLSIGFMASADSPDGENSSALTYERVNYTPVEFQASLNIGITDQFLLSGRYNYQNLFFYKAHVADISLTYRFFK